MDHSTLEERQIPERYLLGQLSPEEATRFEQHSLYCPQCQERLEATEAMLDGLRTAASEEAASAARLGFLAWLARRGSGVRWSLAAVLALAILPLALPASALAPGLYHLRADAQPAEPGGEPTPAGSYAFRAVDWRFFSGLFPVFLSARRAAHGARALPGDENSERKVGPPRSRGQFFYRVARCGQPKTSITSEPSGGSLKTLHGKDLKNGRRNFAATTLHQVWPGWLERCPRRDRDPWDDGS